MTQAAAESTGQATRESFINFQMLRKLGMAGAIAVGGFGCGNSAPTEVSTQQPTTNPTNSNEGLSTTNQIPTTPSSETSTSLITTTTVSETTTTTILPDAIRHIDFKNFTYETDACQDSVVTWPTKVVDGTATHSDSSGQTAITVSGNVVYGDVTNDGIEEAVVPLWCNTGGSAQIYANQVYGLEGGAPKRMGVLGATSGQETLRVKPKQIIVTGGEILVNEAHYAPGDPIAAPSEQATMHWRWDGSQFLLSAADVQKPVVSTPEVKQGPSDISINGVGPIHPGMSRNEITQLGFTFTPGCSPLEGIQKGPLGMAVTFGDDGNVETVVVGSSNIATRSGVVVGDSVAKLTSTYPSLGAPRRVEGANGSLDVYVFKTKDPADAGKWLLFVTGGGELKWITLAKDGKGLNLDC